MRPQRPVKTFQQTTIISSVTKGKMLPLSKWVFTFETHCVIIFLVESIRGHLKENMLNDNMKPIAFDQTEILFLYYLCIISVQQIHFYVFS